MLGMPGGEGNLKKVRENLKSGITTQHARHARRGREFEKSWSRRYASEAFKSPSKGLSEALYQTFGLRRLRMKLCTVEDSQP